MFEDLNSDQQSGAATPEPKAMPQATPPMPPINNSMLSGEPEDILADVDSTSPQLNKQATPPQPPMSDIGPAQPLTDLPGAEVMAKKHRSGGSKKIYYIIGGVVLAAIIVIALIQFNASPTYNEYENFVNDPINNTQDNTQDDTDQGVIDNTDDTTDNTITEPETVPSPDEDGDGLTNDQEAAIGTDPFNPDSDNDGLFDKEEVVVYKTDPLNPDTDGDTYLDGSEVKSGYNPSGPGELLQLPPIQN